MAHIRKLSNGTFQASIYAGKDHKGKKLYKYVTRDKKHDCVAAARDIEQEIENRTFVNIENIKLSDYMDRWYKLNEIRLSPTTLRSYKIYIEAYFKPKIGNFKLAEITSMHIKEFYNELMKPHKAEKKNAKTGKIEMVTKPGIKGTTALKVHSVLNEALEDAMKSKNPCRDVKAPKKSKYPARILTETEFQTLHSYISGTDDELPILLAAWCGMRLGEVFGLRWKDINFKTGTISIRQTQVKTGPQQYFIKSPKSENGKRDIPVNEYIINLFKNLKAKEKVTELDKNEQQNKLILTEKPDVFSKQYERILKACNIPKTRFHDLRHYCATMLYINNISDQYAALMLGHDIMVLKQIYQHLQLTTKNEIESKVKSIFVK